MKEQDRWVEGTRDWVKKHAVWDEEAMGMVSGTKRDGLRK